MDTITELPTLNDLLIERGWTCRRLADETNIPLVTVQVAAGRSTWPQRGVTAETKNRLATKFGREADSIRWCSAEV